MATGADQEKSVVYRVPDKPRLQIGSIDGDGSSLFGVTDVIRLRDGRILVAEGGSGALKFFDSQGAFLRSLGRTGDGPGEFRSLYRVAELEDGRLAVLDPLLRRVTVFSADGGLEETYQVFRRFDETGRRVDPYGFLADGTLVGLEVVEGEGVETHYGDYPGSVLTYREPIVQPVLIDTAGRALPFGRPAPGSETVSQMQMSTGGDNVRVGGRLVSVPFLRTLMVAVRGTRIALGPIEGYMVGVYGADGTLQAGFGGPPPKEVPEGVHEAWLDEWVSGFSSPSERRKWRDRYEEFLSSDSAPATLPSFTSLVVQSGGKVWREVYDPAHTEDDPSRWIVTDPLIVGNFGDTVILPAGFRPYDIGPDYVLGEWRDGLGIEFVRMYDLIEVPSGG
ncbi:6-bladed beta-propeller [Candidatus Palauibacter sp.]|uniref:6-bladed beta-propeller n=1 Tax=Candidatus Palauibacter sp. TaxID=3101350 RepID=UPI003B5B9AD0